MANIEGNKDFSMIRDEVRSGQELDRDSLHVLFDVGIKFVADLTNSLSVTFWGAPEGPNGETFRRYVYGVTLERMLKLSKEALGKGLKGAKSLKYYEQLKGSVEKTIEMGDDSIPDDSFRNALLRSINMFGDEEPDPAWSLDVIRKIASSVVPDNEKTQQMISSQNSFD